MIKINDGDIYESPLCKNLFFLITKLNHQYVYYQQVQFNRQKVILGNKIKSPIGVIATHFEGHCFNKVDDKTATLIKMLLV